MFVAGFLSFGTVAFAAIQLRPIPQNIPDDDPLVRFAPTVHQISTACIPGVWADKEGAHTNFHDAVASCRTRVYAGQIIGKKVQYKNKWALVFSAYYPNDGIIYKDPKTPIVEAANWVTSVVWLNSLTDDHFEYARPLIPLNKQGKDDKGISGGPGSAATASNSFNSYVGVPADLVGEMTNPIDVPADFKSPAANTFTTTLSDAGYHWGTGAMPPKLSRNVIIDWDIYSKDNANAEAFKQYALDATNPTLNVFPFTPGTSVKSDGSDPAVAPVSTTASLNCLYEDIVRHQYDFFYGQGTQANYCV